MKDVLAQLHCSYLLPSALMVFSLFHWPQSTCVGTTLRPKYLTFGYMDPWGKSGLGITILVLGVLLWECLKIGDPNLEP